MKVLFNSSSYMILNWQLHELGSNTYLARQQKLDQQRAEELFEVFDKYLGKKIALNREQVIELEKIAHNVQGYHANEQQAYLQDWLDQLDMSQGLYFDVH